MTVNENSEFMSRKFHTEQECISGHKHRSIIKFCEISGSHGGGYDEESTLGC
jgi:hypothetical protein